MRNYTAKANNNPSDKQYILLRFVPVNLYLSQKSILKFSKTVQNYDQ